MTRRLFVFAGIAVAGAAAGLAAQQPLPAIHPIGPIEHVTTEAMKAVSQVRELPGRRVLVNDIVDHRVLLFDSTLAHPTAVADSTASTANAYGNMPGGLIAYRGDSTLFVDPASLSMLVLDGGGKIARVMSVPRPNEAIFLIGGPFGTTGFDPAGRLVYRGNTMRMAPPPAGKGSGEPQLPQFPDSAPIVRVTLATRAEDTVAYFKIPPTQMTITRTENGGFTAMSTINPMPVVDDWALLPDGTVAVVRGRDFHVDWYHPDGTHTSTPKIPFDWQRLTDDQKAAVIDSAKQVLEKRRAERNAALQETRTATSTGDQRRVTASGGGDAGGMGMGAMVMVVRKEGADGGAQPPTRGGSNVQVTLPPLQFVPPYALPDYRPAFGTGATRCDLQGNLWIRTSQATDGRPVYDIVDEHGALVDRVQLPPFRTIAGFGQGVVYMAVSDSTGGVHLERARLK
ncbi:MAG TPA: hypothetical protein VFT41_01900 [Gemmatimonadaceae bacterium]|nr:hypothetical protein [Gemmatimonadaceae bacterium]